VRHHSGETYGVRGLLASRPDLAATLGRLGLTQVTAEALGRPAIPIDAIFFDKYPDANWAVPAHQDVVVPVPTHAGLAQVQRQRLRGAQMYGEPQWPFCSSCSLFVCTLTLRTKVPARSMSSQALTFAAAFLKPNLLPARQRFQAMLRRRG
jgi:hypothetical protein